MIKEIINKWDLHKSKLENYFATTNQSEYSTYENIVKKTIEIIINTNDFDYDNYAVDKMTVINHGDYQGTQLFIIPKDTYLLSIEDYLFVHNYYGSCSGCDALQSIQQYDDGLPTEEQIKDYMLLSLHLIQEMRYLTDNN
jgi:hypothetical protein